MEGYEIIALVLCVIYDLALGIRRSLMERRVLREYLRQAPKQKEA